MSGLRCIFSGCSLFVLLVGCVAPPADPAEAASRRVAGIEYAMRSCGGFVGGFGDIRELRKLHDKEIVTARSLGATNAMLVKARQDISNMLNTSVAFTSQQEVCGQLLAKLALVI